MSRSPRFWLLLILATALSLRLGAAVGMQWLLDHRLQRTYLIEGDAEGYWMLGRAIAAGDDYAIYTPPRRVLRMPGFPAVLAVSIGMFGESHFAARLLLAGVGTLACAGVYWLGRELADSTSGLRAAALAAVSPTLVGFTPILLSETTFAAAMCLSLAVLARAIQPLSGIAIPHESGARPGGRNAGLAGLAALAGGLAGLATMVRPSWLLALPLAYAALLVFRPQRGRIIRSGLCAGVGLALVLLPWGLRNQRATGHFVLTTLWSGPSLYDGLNPEATGDSNMAFFDRDNLMGRGMSEYDVNRHYTQAAVRYAVDHPGRTLQLAFAKLVRYWKPWPNAAQFGGWGPALAVAVFFLPMIAAAARGMWLTRGDLRLWLIAAGPIVYFSLIHLLYVSSLRYRLPAEYPLLVLSAVGLRSILPGGGVHGVGEPGRDTSA